MKLLDLVLGVVGITLIVAWGVTYATVSFLLTGEAFPND